MTGEPARDRVPNQSDASDATPGSAPAGPAVAASPPGGLLRLALRAPIWLYRWRLGWVLGHRFLLLTHRGRTTGRVRQTVVEVVRYDPATRESVVFAGWRGETDWYRNLRARPALRVETGGRSLVPRQRFLSPDETERELTAYVARHPLASRYVLGRVFGLRLNDSAAGRRRAAGFFRGVAFRPAADDTSAGDAPAGR